MNHLAQAGLLCLAIEEKGAALQAKAGAQVSRRSEWQSYPGRLQVLSHNQPSHCLSRATLMIFDSPVLSGLVRMHTGMLNLYWIHQRACAFSQPVWLTKQL